MAVKSTMRSAERRNGPKVAAVVPEPRITIIDDDDSLRAALVGLVRSLGYTASEFASAEDFLASPPESDCIVTDIQMPGLSGIDLKNELMSKCDAGDHDHRPRRHWP